MKRKNRKSKGILIVALILCITIGYAVLTTTLNITGNSEIKNAKWDIHFDNLVVDSSSVDATTPATIDANKTTINYGVYLAKPGDSYSFTVDVVNEGTIDGMINVVSNTGLTEEQQKYVAYSITYDDGSQLQLKDGLKAGDKKNIKVIVKYKDDVNPEDLPKEEKTIDLTFKVEYVQADDTVRAEAGSTMKSYSFNSTDDYHNSTYRSKVTKVVTKTDVNVPDEAIEQWDVSSAGDGSVVAYAENDGSGNGTYKVTIGSKKGKIIVNSGYLFIGFSALKEVDLSNFDTSQTTSLEGMFQYCTSLTSLDLSGFDTSKVTNMVYMFGNCTNLTSVNLSSFDTSNVTNMSSMFYSCNNLASLDVSNFDTSNVTTMEYMFNSCSSLTNLDLSKFNTSKVTNMGSMFNYCWRLTSLNVSNFDTSSVTNMSNMFKDCIKLTTTITMSNSATSLYTNMFNGAATDDGAQITVNYTSTTSDLVENMIATKSDTSNVVKGTLIS